MEGNLQFCDLSKKLVFGQECTELNRIVTVQTVSGTGALRLAVEFLKRFLPGSTIHVSKPTWITHHAIIKDGGLEFKEYPYYNSTNKDFNFQGMLDYLNKLPPKAFVLLHAAAHNPTG